MSRGGSKRPKQSDFAQADGLAAAGQRGLCSLGAVRLLFAVASRGAWNWLNS